MSFYSYGCLTVLRVLVVPVFQSFKYLTIKKISISKFSSHETILHLIFSCDCLCHQFINSFGLLAFCFYLAFLIFYIFNVYFLALFVTYFILSFVQLIHSAALELKAVSNSRQAILDGPLLILPNYCRDQILEFFLIGSPPVKIHSDVFPTANCYDWIVGG